MSKVALIHTVTSLPGVFQELCGELLPDGTEVVHIVDDSLLSDARLAGHVTPQIRRRLAGHVWAAADGGADAVLVTCSSMGEVVDQLGDFVSVPLLRIDEAMVRTAVRQASRVGVAATLATTLQPTANLVRRMAAEAGRTVDVEAVLCDGAFDAVRSGDVARHDQLVKAAVTELAERVDVVILAQASMARAVGDQPASVEVLSSPRLAVSSLASVLTE